MNACVHMGKHRNSQQSSLTMTESTLQPLPAPGLSGRSRRNGRLAMSTLLLSRSPTSAKSLWFSLPESYLKRAGLHADQHGTNCRSNHSVPLVSSTTCHPVLLRFSFHTPPASPDHCTPAPAGQLCTPSTIECTALALPVFLRGELVCMPRMTRTACSRCLAGARQRGVSARGTQALCHHVIMWHRLSCTKGERGKGNAHRRRRASKEQGCKRTSRGHLLPATEIDAKFAMEGGRWGESQAGEGRQQSSRRRSKVAPFPSKVSVWVPQKADGV